MQVAFGRVRRKTEPTGPGGNIELPKYFFKLHETAPTGLGYSTHNLFLKLTPMVRKKSKPVKTLSGFLEWASQFDDGTYVFRGVPNDEYEIQVSA